MSDVGVATNAYVPPQPERGDAGPRLSSSTAAEEISTLVPRRSLPNAGSDSDYQVSDLVEKSAHKRHVVLARRRQAKAWSNPSSKAVKRARRWSPWLSTALIVAGAALTLTGVGAGIGVGLLIGGATIGVVNRVDAMIDTTLEFRADKAEGKYADSRVGGWGTWGVKMAANTLCIALLAVPVAGHFAPVIPGAVGHLLQGGSDGVAAWFNGSTHLATAGWQTLAGSVGAGAAGSVELGTAVLRKYRYHKGQNAHDVASSDQDLNRNQTNIDRTLQEWYGISVNQFKAIVCQGMNSTIEKRSLSAERFKERNVSFEEVVDDEDSQVIKLTFSNGTTTCEAYLSENQVEVLEVGVRDQDQGVGHARGIFNVIRQLNSKGAGIVSASAAAARSIGPYAWIRYGLCPGRQGRRRIMHHALNKITIYEHSKGDSLDPQEKILFDQIKEDKDHPTKHTMRRIADLRMRVPMRDFQLHPDIKGSNDGTITFGKAIILSERPWQGTFDFSEDQLYLDAYLEMKKKVQTESQLTRSREHYVDLTWNSGSAIDATPETEDADL